MNGTTLAGILLAAISFSLVVLSRVQLGKSFAVTPKANELVKHGLYSRIQNPMYVFADLTVVGIALAVHRWYVLLVFAILLPVQVRNVLKERKVLREKFEESYEAYQRSTWF
jgi:protein-S-isoprenylcysteine O-methyltransferase Ste14